MPMPQMANPAKPAPVVRITNILHRHDPVVLGYAPAGRGDFYEVVYWHALFRSATLKKALKEAGVPDGLTLKTLVRAERTYEQSSVYMADQLAKIGIKLELDVRELAIRQKLVDEGAFNSHSTMNSLPYPDPENLVRLWAPPAGGLWGMNWARLEDAKIFELLDKQSRALDPAERKKIVRELDLRMIELATRPVVWWKQYLVGMWPEVKGYGKRNSNYSFER